MGKYVTVAKYLPASRQVTLLFVEIIPDYSQD